MPRKFFSTGLPRLDQAIGNVTPGDVLLSLISSEGERRGLIQPLSEYSSSMQIPVLYLAADDSPCEELRNAYRLKSLTFAGPKSQSSPGAIGRAVKKWGKGRYIVLEDLSAWKALLRSERRVVELFRLLSKIASEQRSVLIASALKPGLGLDTLGLLKDSATACLDFNTYKQDLFCSLIALRGKYLPGGSIPFRFEPKDLSRPPSRTDEPVEAIPNEAQGNRMRALEGSVFPATSAYQEVFRRAQEAMFLFALDGGYREANAELERVVGYSEDELRILNPLTLISPAHRIRFLRFLAEFRKKKKGRVDVDLIRKNGKTLQVELSAGKLDHGIYLGIIRDAGPRLQMEREHDQLRKLAASEAQNRELVERTSAALAMIEDGKYFYVNRAFHVEVLSVLDHREGRGGPFDELAVLRLGSRQLPKLIMLPFHLQPGACVPDNAQIDTVVEFPSAKLNLKRLSIFSDQVDVDPPFLLLAELCQESQETEAMSG